MRFRLGTWWLTRRRDLASVWVAVLLLALVAPEATPGVMAANPPKNLDVVLLIDNSGSMATNDPDGLRWSAAQLFVDLAVPGDRLAAVVFASDVTPLGDAANGALRSVVGPNDRQALKGLLRPRGPIGATNMEGALTAALDLLRRTGSVNRQVVVFLTDGEPDPPQQRPAVEEAIRRAGQAGVAVFPILLGTATDKALADLMVRETGSMRQDVTGADGLLRAFGRIYALVQPERYIDELDVRPGTSLSFQTNPHQAITEAVLIMPRATGGQTALRDLQLAGEKVLGRPTLSNGARVDESEAEHYQLARVSHNAPLVGEWQAGVGQSSGTGLLIVQSQVVLDLVFPVPSVADSFVSPRVVPAGKPVLVLGHLLQSGSRVAEAQLAVASGGQLIPLDSSGPSANRDVYWKLVNVGSLQVGRPAVLEIQVGSELAPLRLRKQFAVEAANVPPLVIDCPSAADSGLRAGGKLRLAAHFEGSDITQPRVHAYVWSSSADEAMEADLACRGGACEDESLSVQPGRAYEVLFVATATAGGRPYTDAAVARFATGNVVRIDGLDALRDLGTLSAQALQPSVPLTVTALTQEGTPQLTVRTEQLAPMPSKPGAQITPLLSPLTPTGANTYAARLALRGLDSLPPGEYTALVAFESPQAAVSPRNAMVAFRIPRPGLSLTSMSAPAEPACCSWEYRARPTNRIDLGAVHGTGTTIQQDLYFQGAWISETPRVEAELRSLHALGGRQPTVLPVLRAGGLSQAGQGGFRLPLTLELPAGLPPGRYTAQVRLSSPETDIQPADYELTFYLPGGWLAGAWQRLLPIRCFALDWLNFLGPPFPRFKGMVGSGLMLLAIVWVVSLLYQPDGGLAVIPSAGGRPERLRRGRTLFVVLDHAGVPRLTSQAGASRPLVRMWLDTPDYQGPRIRVLPGTNLGGATVGYFSERRRGWYRIPSAGMHLRRSQRLAVFIGRQRYEFVLSTA